MASTTGTDSSYQDSALHRNKTSADESSNDNGSSHDGASPTSAKLPSAGAPGSPQDGLTDANGNPFEIPNYTIKDIHNAIPKHCYERSAATGLYYVFRDLACIAAIFYLFHTYLTPTYVPSTPLRAVLWAFYTVVQGCFGLGVWVLGHECGHQNLSTSRVLNDTVGWILHSALITPYFSWQITHRKHHQVTCNIAEDVVWNPRTRPEYATYLGRMVHEISELGEETPIVAFAFLIVQQIIGWPNYLLTDITGNGFRGMVDGLKKGNNHFNPNSPLFKPRDAKFILLSDLGLAIAIGAYVHLSKTFGWANMFVWYFIPYLWVNHWLAAITFLHHTDPSIPRYTPELWTYARGQAATIDRDFGFIGEHIFHGIIDTHVLHHYVTNIPFYHAREASEAIKPVMGRHYRSDDRGPIGFFIALWKNSRSCQWVEPIEGKRKDVLFFRNRNGVGPKMMKISPTESSTI